MSDLEYICSCLSREELLAQLAEEAAELSQAALKYRRVLTGTNPARIGQHEAFLNVLEEIADVELSLMGLGIPYSAQDTDHICEIIAEKMARWRQSLAAREQQQLKRSTHEEKKNDQTADFPGHPAE